MTKQIKEISVQQGLNELKLYDSKIKNLTFNLDPFFSVDKNNKVVNKNTHRTAEDLTDVAKSSLQKVLDLIDNRDKLKRAIVQSNAKTTLTVAGTEYTVAEAIERKTSVEYKQNLSNHLQTMYAKELSAIQSWNNLVDKKTQSNIESLSGGQDKKEDMLSLIEGLERLSEAKKIGLYEFSVVGKKTNVELINDISEEVQDFLSEVDYKLTESNVITKIQVSV